MSRGRHSNTLCISLTVQQVKGHKNTANCIAAEVKGQDQMSQPANTKIFDRRCGQNTGSSASPLCVDNNFLLQQIVMS